MIINRKTARLYRYSPRPAAFIKRLETIVGKLESLQQDIGTDRNDTVRENLRKAKTLLMEALDAAPATL